MNISFSYSLIFFFLSKNSNMASSTLKLEFYRNEIISLFHSEKTAKFIADHIKELENTNISQRTIQWHLQKWEVFKQIKTEDFSQLHAWITVLFYQSCLEDKKMLDVLHQEDYVLEERALQQIWKQLGLSWRISILNWEESDARLFEIVQKKLDKGTIEKYGWDYLHTYFWCHEHNFSQCVAAYDCYINCYNFFLLIFHFDSRDWLFAAVQILNPDGVSWWLCDLQWHWKEYIVPEPNYLWSIDGHVKLKAWGIEIYAAVDAYSWNVVWNYVEITACTAVSVLRQYVDTLKDEQVHSCILRSDCGVETPLVAAAHHEFVKKHDSDIDLEDCYFYEISTKNVWVEKWWGNLTESQLYVWWVSTHIFDQIQTYSNDYIGLFLLTIWW